MKNSQLMSHLISENNLQIDVQSAQQQHLRQALDPSQTVDQSFTPTMVRRSIGSKSAAKQQERISFLDKTAQ